MPGVAPGWGPYGTAWLVPPCRHGPRCRGSASIPSLVLGAGTWPSVPALMLFRLSANSPFCFPPSAFPGGLPHGKLLV